MPLERLQKILSSAGVCSRRAAEKLITAGRVRVDGEIVRELGTKADAHVSDISVNGQPLRRSAPLIYLMLNKPRDCVTTLDDPEGRPTVMKFVKKIKERIYPVGRLDYHSEGLLLFTNDGEFSNRVISSGHGITKTYWVKVSGTPAAENLDKLRRGIPLDNRRTLPAEIRALALSRQPDSRRETSDAGNPWFEVTLREGRQNQIRRMFERIGHPVRKLRRVSIGRLHLGTLQPGEFRHLTPAEVRQFLTIRPAARPPARSTGKPRHE